MTHGAAHDAAKRVARRAFVGRAARRRDRKRAGAQMIGNDAMRRLALAVLINTSEIGDGFDQRAERSIL